MNITQKIIGTVLFFQRTEGGTTRTEPTAQTLAYLRRQRDAAVRAANGIKTGLNAADEAIREALRAGKPTAAARAARDALVVQIEASDDLAAHYADLAEQVTLAAIEYEAQPIISSAQAVIDQSVAAFDPNQFDTENEIEK